MFYFSTQEKCICKLAVLQIVNCICSQLLSNGYKVADALNITGKNRLEVEKGKKEM